MENQETSKPLKTLWKHPWGYKESFIILFDLLVLAFILELLIPHKSSLLPVLPWSITVFLSFAVAIFSIWILLRDKKWVQWFASVPAAMASITLFFIAAIFMGLFPQGITVDQPLMNMLGLTNVMQSWLMIISTLFLLLVLGFTACKRAFPLKKKNIGFLLNHVGLWIVLAAASLGASDLQRLKLQLYENGEFTNIAVDDQKQMFTLPFSVQLVDFDIDEYNPKLLIFNPQSRDFINKAGKSFQMIDSGFHVTILNYELRVLRFIKYAELTDSGFYATEKPFAVSAAFMEVLDHKANRKMQGWISPGGFGRNPDVLELNSELAISLSPPEPKEYSSILAVRHSNNSIDSVRVIVNKPHSVEGFNLYQLSYNNQLGKWSNYSVIEVVSDPWLPIVYVGFFMLMAGAVFMVWWGRRIYVSEDKA
jgi:hypothetical protein